MTIREATRQDVPVIMKIIRESFATVYDRLNIRPETWPSHAIHMKPRDVEALFDIHWRVFLSEGRGAACGCIAVTPVEKNAAHLMRLAVLPSHRGRGIGTALVKHGIAEAEQAGARQIKVMIIADDVALQHWYERRGFRTTETRPCEGVPFMLTHMIKELPGQQVTEGQEAS